MFEGIKKAFEYLFGLLVDLFSFIAESVQAIFQPIIDIFIGIGYFIYKIGVVLYEILAVLGGVAKVALGLIQGLYRTILTFDYDGTAINLPGSLGDALENLQPLFATLQFNKIGFVVMFSVWVFTALAASKIIQTFRGGNDS